LQLVTPQLAPTTTEPIGELDARFALRLPTDLKERIDQLAGAEGISANTWMIRTLSTAATNPSPTQHGHFRIGSTMRGRGKS
jgi:hypothetical protein